MDAESTIKVAIADAHLVYRTGLRKALESRPFLDILWAESNGDGLLQKMQIKTPDILLMDVNIPKMDGLKVIKTLRNNYKDLIIVVLSLYEGYDLVTKTMKMGANAYLRKISNPDEIYQAIITCMNENLYLNDLVQNALYSNFNNQRVAKNSASKGKPFIRERNKNTKISGGRL